MKNVLLILTILTFATGSVDAQKMNRSKMKLLKISYITDAIKLTPTEAEKFWPVYNLYTDEIQQLKRTLDVELKQAIISSGGIENISESDAQNTLDHMLTLEQQVGDNKIKLITELSKIISAKKIVTLQKAEKDFNRQILQEFGRRKRMQGQ
jgi:hypothetical protein